MRFLSLNILISDPIGKKLFKELETKSYFFCLNIFRRIPNISLSKKGLSEVIWTINFKLFFLQYQLPFLLNHFHYLEKNLSYFSLRF